jgi:hypothetical protein
MLWTVVAIAPGVGAGEGAGATARVDAVGMPRCCRDLHIPDPRNIFSREVLSGGSGPDLLEVKRNVFHSAWVNGSHGYPVPIRCPARLITPDEKHSATRARHEPPPKLSGFPGNTYFTSYLSFLGRQEIRIWLVSANMMW